MIRISTFIFLLGSLVALNGCSGSKSFSKRAAKLEAAGLYKEASDNYLTALQRNPKNVNAQIGLKKTGEQVLGEMGANFYKAHQAGNAKEAVYAYLGAKEYIGRTQRFVNLKIPPYYEEYYEESKGVYLNDIYDQGNVLLDEQKFNSAESLFREIMKIDSEFKDVKELLDYSTIEPMYRKGVSLLEAGQNRKAYFEFKEVVHRKGNYKEAVRYKDEALKNATVTVAFIPPEGRRRFGAMENGVSAKILQQLVNSGNPFIRVVDRENTDRIIKEQHLGLSGIVNEATAAEAGEMLGATILLTGKVLNMTVQPGNVEETVKKGYRAYTVTKTNPETKEEYKETAYAKAKYKEYQGAASVGASYEFRLISTKTGEVIASDVFNAASEDRVHYARYEGNRSELVPGTWKFLKAPSPLDKVNTNSQARRNLQQLLKNDGRGLKKSDDLKLEVANEIGGKVADRVNAYNPEQ